MTLQTVKNFFIRLLLAFGVTALFTLTFRSFGLTSFRDGFIAGMLAGLAFDWARDRFQ